MKQKKWNNTDKLTTTQAQMTYRSYLLLLALLTLILAGCKEKNEVKVASLQIDETAVEEVDSTVYGNCYGAAMNSFSLITNSGDTIFFSLDEGDLSAIEDGADKEMPPSDVQGGLLDGDKLAVIATQVDGEDVAKKVLNLTTLLGRWTSLDKNFEIKDGGQVESHVSAESKPYTSWKIHNGKLVLAPDTFEVLTLGPDSMYLENANGIFEFKRQD